MAIPSFTPGQTLTAAQLNTITAALPIVDGWTSYTPTLVQPGAVTKTVTRASYCKFGRWVHVELTLVLTGTGTASNAIIVGLPPFAPQGLSTNSPMGVGRLFDTSASLQYPFFPVYETSTTFRLLQTGSTAENHLGSAGALFTAALASGDIIYATFSYESTT